MNPSLPPLIPKKVLFGNPDKLSPKISPDGIKMAYIAPLNGVLNVWVGKRSEKKFTPITQDTNRGIRNYFWQLDSQHILYFQDKDGDENWLLYQTNLETHKTCLLTPMENVQVQLVEYNPSFPETMLLAINQNNPKLHDLYKLCLKSGKLELVKENTANLISWLVDPNLQLRGGLAPTPDGGFELLLWKEEQWVKIIHWNPEDALNSRPLTFSKDGHLLYLLDSRNANTAQFVQLNLKTMESHTLAKDEQYDVSTVCFHPQTYHPQLVGFTKARLEWLVLDESIREDIEILSNLQRGDFHIYNRDQNDQFWLVGFSQDNAPHAYYIYDKSAQKADFLFHHRQDLKNYTLAPMRPITYQARDGLTIHGYITFPPRLEPTNLPLVLNVHGGPWHRDVWGFHPEAQWLANRGYICLQVNYRGSTGYGKKFLNAGNKQWGRKMQDDLSDAVLWAIQQGYADPQKIAIYGGSYGGYAALAGATFTPQLYRCAIDVVGPSNLITFINTIPPYWSSLLGMMYQRVGNPHTEEEFLKSISPYFHVDKIQIPLLIAQGANDPRVKKSESEQIVQALREKNIPHHYLLFEDEGHGFAKPENRLKFYHTMEQFLAKHLGGRMEGEAA
ncbi:MAG: S9 family peptidase [Planctomycetota bacterium]|nr:MAG: S9 family peptidase [Planctomycetota bacterium]